MKRRPVTLIVIAVLVSIQALFGAVPRAHAGTTIQVNTTSNTLGDGHCSLQEAVAAANTNAAQDSGACPAGSGTDTITFNIGASGSSQTITLDIKLVVSSPVVIDGTSQPGFNTTTRVPLIEITGSPSQLIGLSAGSAGSTIQGLRLTDTYPGPGAFADILAVETDSNHIVANYIGTNGTQIVGPYSAGIHVVASSNNTVGGPGASDRNLFGAATGIRITGGSGNLIQGNYFGVRADGVTPLEGLLKNGYGLFLQSGAVDAVSNTIRGNVITGYQIGVFLRPVTATTTVAGNLIGVGAGGTTALGNSRGISIEGAGSNTIGGTSAADRNVIAGNSEANIFLANDGLNIPNDNVIQGNYIGTTADGLSALTPGDGTGIYLAGGQDNTIGGTDAGSGNLVSGNQTGIRVETGVAGTIIRGNRIGTNAAGTAAIANGDGISAYSAVNIGDAVTPGNNLISGNTTYYGISTYHASGTTIYGNRFGLTADGSGGIPNGTSVDLSNTTATVAQNWFGYSDYDGLYMEFDGNVAAGSSNNCFTFNTHNGSYSGNSGATQPLTNNWWGSPTGPTHSGNPGGTGDHVSDYITYSPFLTTPPAACPGTVVNVTIGGVSRGDYFLAPSGQKRVNYAGLDSGPVTIKSTWGPKIIAAIRDSWWDGTTWSDYTQLMGLPAGQVSDTYVFPAYNNVTLDEQLRFGNVDTVDTTVKVTIGGVERGSYLLHPSEATRVNYAGLDSGPVVVQGTPGVKIIAAIRDSWWDGRTWSSYSQLMGLPANLISDTYVFPAYNNITLDEQLRFGNVDTVDTTVTVTIGGVFRGSYLLHPSQAVRVNYAGVDTGPVVVQGTPNVKIVAAIRDSWWDGTTWSDYAQLMGLPASQISDTYVFPAYNNVTLDEQLRFGNVDTVDTTVMVTIGGASRGSYLLHPSEAIRLNYAGLDSGPVVVQGTLGVDIIAAIRELVVGWQDLEQLLPVDGTSRKPSVGQLRVPGL